ncbi:MAG: phosphonopyruvate decarboxylase [Firmicutes bacterium]|nr:phosphonopyruvate decarboxylase [Bacillota bacterium]
MINTKDFYDYLVKNDMNFFTGVPDSLLANICACIKENSPEKNNIIAANEGNAVGIACGYHIATGNYGVVYMQNSGEGNAVNPLLSIADEDVYSIPMLLMIGWRGEPGTKDEPQHKKQGKVTFALLDAMGIEYEILSDDYIPQIDAAKKYMQTHNKPYAIIVRKGMFSEYRVQKETNDYPLTREQALECILDKIGENDFIVSTTGKTSREIFEIREARGQSHSGDFLTVGGMGHTSSIALGMSLGTDKNVYCIDGDGSFIMHMGSFAITADKAGANFKYILNNNGAHESVGGQPTVGLKIDVPAILKAVGFRHVHTAETAEEISAGMDLLANENLSALIINTHQGSRENLGRPTISPQENKKNMMKKFGSK